MRKVVTKILKEVRDQGWGHQRLSVQKDPINPYDQLNMVQQILNLVSKSEPRIAYTLKQANYYVGKAMSDVGRRDVGDIP